MPEQVKVQFVQGYGVAVTDCNNLVVKSSQSIKEVGGWLQQHGYAWAKGSNGVWVKQ